MEEDIALSFLTKSLFQRTIWTLVPFAAAIALLYSLLLMTAMESSEDQIVKQYLQREFERFSADFESTSGGVTLPYTSYLSSHWVDDPGLDPNFRSLKEGLHESSNNQYQILVGIPAGSDRAIVMIVDEELLSTLDEMETPLIAAISIIGIIVTLFGGILATYFARKITQPIISLAEDASEDISHRGGFSGSKRQDEIGTLSRALTNLVKRLDKSLDRERDFTRHASHEMRSPLAVIGNSLSLLKMENIPDDKKRRGFERIEQSCIELQMLLDVFLCLGREDFSIPADALNVEELLISVLDRYEKTIESKTMSVDVNLPSGLTVTAPPALFTILLNNMVRNAVYHGNEYIKISIDQNRVEIINALPDKTSSSQHGYGLEICRRVSEQLGWQFSTVRNQRTYQSVAAFRQGT